ncbi:MAG: T9SS type A sorting domain-containing protein [Flavobacteriaceae bacterium]|nr:T9SS type A sorting domain-containing protein [Flavobacteriaceae bacterium]
MKKLSYLFLALLVLACTTDDNNNVDNINTLEKEWLYTHTALEATATSSTTIVMPFTEDIFAFTDRPNREFKYISGDEFASYWNDYDDENSFKLDPPNAVLTWVDADGVSEVEVVITDANFDGANMIYTIENTTITANQSFEDVSLFVDGNGSTNAVYLASNGITIKASAGAEVGSEGILNGLGYVIVDLTILNGMIAAQDDLTRVCTSLITDMNALFSYSAFNQDISSWDVSNVTNFTNFVDNSSISVLNYDALFTGWSALTLQQGVTFSNSTEQYCSSGDARQSIIDTYGWTITDAGLDCSTLSVEDETQLAISIYPNPTNDKLFIQGLSDATEVFIYNILGKEVISTKNTSNINVKALPKGVYIIRISDGVGQTNRRFIKN